MEISQIIVQPIEPVYGAATRKSVPASQSNLVAIRLYNRSKQQIRLNWM